MDLCQELKAAEYELAFEFSQSDWEDALIECFKQERSLGSALLKASKMTQRGISDDEWRRLMTRASTLKPVLSVRARLSKPVRAFLADNATYAVGALWDGDYEKAKRLLSKGGKSLNFGTKTRREVRAAEREIAGVVEIRFRERDKRRDWNVCK